MNDDRLAELMVKVADGAATAAEREELMGWIADKPELRAELDEHRAMRAVTDGWMRRLEVDLVQDRVEAAPSTRLWTGLGIAALVVGMLVLSVAGPLEAMRDPEVPVSIKAGIGLSLGGGLVLLVAVIVGRLRTAKHDPYTEVIR